jgi:uncharacterized protein (TIGR02246 family)
MCGRFVRTCQVVGVAVALASVAPVSLARAQGPQITSADSTAIRDVWRELDESWNARDVQWFSGLFSEDGSLWFVNAGAPFEGRATIRDRYTQQFRRYTPDVRHVTRVSRIRLVAPGIAMVDGDADIVGNAPGGGSQSAVLRHYIGTALMVHTGGRWHIHSMRAFLTPAAAASPGPNR